MKNDSPGGKTLTPEDETRIQQKARDIFGVNHDEVSERYGFFHGAKYATYYERERIKDLESMLWRIQELENEKQRLRHSIEKVIEILPQIKDQCPYSYSLISNITTDALIP
jgi:hypothetical protein